MWRAVTIVTVSVFLAAMTCNSESGRDDAETGSGSGARASVDFEFKSKVTASDGREYDSFAEELATDGEHLIVGAPSDNERGGAAYVYPLDADGLGAEVRLVPDDLTKDDFFGSDVDVSGDWAIVGARRHDPLDRKLASQRYGAAYFFRRSGDGWVQDAFVQASDRQLNHEFGGAVAISGDYAVVGAIHTQVGDNPGQGQVYVFRRGDGGWTETQILAVPNGESSDYFGTAVDIDGDNLLVSGVHHPGGPYRHDIGAVWSYRLGGDGRWRLASKLQPEDLEDGNNFGTSIDISGDVAIVGAHLAHGAETGTGTAYVFRWGSGGWEQEARLAAASGRLGDDFGHRVAIDGDRALVGAWFTQVGDEGMQQGAAYVFERRSGGWQEVAKLIAGDGAYQDTFGSAVVIGPEQLLIGAKGDADAGGQDAGALYVYE